MDSAEQAALSESQRDSSQSQSHSQYRHFDLRHLSEHVSSDDDFPPKPMRRFEKLVVNLTHSSVLVPAGISLTGMYMCMLTSKWDILNFIVFCACV